MNRKKHTPLWVILVMVFYTGLLILSHFEIKELKAELSQGREKCECGGVKG